MRGPGHFLVPSLSSIHDLCCLSLDWSSDFSFPSNHLPPCRISLVFLLTLCSILFPSRWTASPSNSFANGSDHPHHRHYYPFPHRHPPLATNQPQSHGPRAVQKSFASTVSEPGIDCPLRRSQRESFRSGDSIRVAWAHLNHLHHHQPTFLGSVPFLPFQFLPFLVPRLDSVLLV
ncbi:hypothetical protein BDQ94DRAFT_135098 [Aspergillus welwitschiae]|uniref:Uncharacterized protein n=1 Tax=Aspergillus welwitschiae TaxID=1341132 RepID=A0A3F3QF03_9EURO|nr:hypothetical protein BDQ94DRAFT_135098 [Aspergillus welwitschiae]RDH37823.1 hypothetical protein BDQ94DRAFT_135098 [Aspergillus welwitschiae]